MRDGEGEIVSGRAPEPVGAYPHARRVGDLLFLSGIGPRKRGTPKIPGVEVDEKGRIVSLDFEAQCVSVFENVRTVLEECGSSLDRVVDVLVFLTNMERDFVVYNRVYAEWFAGEGKANPARTTVEVSALPRAGEAPISIELKVIAAV